MPKISASSAKFQVNGLDIKSVGRSAIDGAIGLAITLIPMFTVGASYQIGGKDITPMVVVISTLVIKFLRKYLTDHTQDPPAHGMQ